MSVPPLTMAPLLELESVPLNVSEPALTMVPPSYPLPTPERTRLPLPFLVMEKVEPPSLTTALTVSVPLPLMSQMPLAPRAILPEMIWLLDEAAVRVSLPVVRVRVRAAVARVKAVAVSSVRLLAVILAAVASTVVPEPKAEPNTRSSAVGSVSVLQLAPVAQLALIPPPSQVMTAAGANPLAKMAA